MRAYDAARRGVSMDAARMHALACQYAVSKTGEDLDAALSACLPLCALIARRFSGRGVEYDDLYQTACLACVNALKAFEPERNLKFTTFVTPSVTGAVRNCLRDQASLLRTPRVLRRQALALQKARAEYCEKNHEEPSVRALSQVLGWEGAQVLSVLAVQRASQVASLDQTDEEGLSLGERIPALEKGYEQLEQRQALAAALAILTEMERKLLHLRYSLHLSQRETAQRLGRTQMQISRMERRVLLSLRKEMTEEL